MNILAALRAEPWLTLAGAVLIAVSPFIACLFE